MKNILAIILTILMTILFAGCSFKFSRITLGEYYPKFYAGKTRSILVLPARNNTTSADAADHFRYTITKPLAEKGYYVFPAHVVDAFFKSENITDDFLIHSIPVSKLKEIFAADTILYVDINSWDTGYQIITSHVDVGLSFSLIDANTEEEIWQSGAYASSYEGPTGNDGIAGLIVAAVKSAINASTDYTKLAYTGNEKALTILPAGQYHPEYKKDKDAIWRFSDKANLENNRVYVDEYFIFGFKNNMLFGLNQIDTSTLRPRNRINGYSAFLVLNDMDSFIHSGYSNYYITKEIKGKKYLRNRFFLYENNRPFLLLEGKKVFVQTEADGTIPYYSEKEKALNKMEGQEDSERFYFNIEKIIELKLLESKS